jgi:hypothetical protein
VAAEHVTNMYNYRVEAVHAAACTLRMVFQLARLSKTEVIFPWGKKRRNIKAFREGHKVFQLFKST